MNSLKILLGTAVFRFLFHFLSYIWLCITFWSTIVGQHCFFTLLRSEKLPSGMFLERKSASRETGMSSFLLGTQQNSQLNYHPHAHKHKKSQEEKYLLRRHKCVIIVKSTRRCGLQLLPKRKRKSLPASGLGASLQQRLLTCQRGPILPPSPPLHLWGLKAIHPRVGNTDCCAM